MKDPERLSVTGSDEDRRLLRAADGVRVPDRVKHEVARAIDARRFARRPLARRIAFATAGVLLGGTAFAALMDVDLRRWIQGAPVETQPPAAGTRRPVVEPLPSPPAAQPPPAPARRPARVGVGEPAAPVAEAPPAAAPPLAPTLDLHGFLQGDPAAAAKPAPAPTLRIARAGRRDVVLAISADGVRGDVRGTPLALTLTPTSITGRLGEDEVLIRVFGTRRAQGTVGGREVGFTMKETARGWMVGASFPEHGGRLEVEPTRVSFLPGCDRDLALARDAVYEGTCADGTRTRLELPAAFLTLPESARLVVLGILLSEPDPSERDSVRALFPPP